MQKLNNFLLLLPIIFSLFSFFATNTKAQEKVESTNYRIVFPNFNSGAGIPTSSNYAVNTTLGQTGPGLYSSTGYRIKSGFQYINSIIPFSFSISDIQKSFGSLVPNTPSTTTSNLTVSSGGASGYSVKLFEDNPLTTSDNISTIIDTLCDSTCSETSAGSWTSTTKYGFGFNMSGDDVPSDFINSNYYRQFSDASLSENPATIMTSNNVGRSRSAVITYKINISGLQTAGSYQNILTFIAVPGY